MSRTTKGHNYGKFTQNSLKIYSDNLHHILNHYIKFQDPRLNTFWDTLLTRINSDFFKGAELCKYNYAGHLKNKNELNFHGVSIYKILKP